MRTLKTGISPHYVKNWTLDEAIRELFQNALDSKQEFGCSTRYDWRNGRGSIQDTGPGLEPRHLAVGISEKQDSSRGQFGEGLKIALLVFAREGKHIAIKTRGKQITPRIAYDEDYGTDVLVLDIREVKTPDGTQIRFDCEREQWDAGKWYFVEFRRANGSLKMVSENVSNVAGEIWVNGTLVYTALNSLFGYHVTGRGGINRDRSVVDLQKINPHMRIHLAKVTDKEAVKKVVEHLFDGSDKWEVAESPSPYAFTEESKKVWHKAFIETVGKNAVLSSQYDQIDQQLAHNGYHVIKLPFGWITVWRELGLPTAEDAAKKCASKVVTKLTEEEQENLDTAIALATIHLGKPENLQVVDQIQLNPMDPNQTAQGTWQRVTNEINIARDALQNKKTAVHVVIHERLHQKTGYGDRTSEFENAWNELVVQLLGV